MQIPVVVLIIEANDPAIYGGVRVSTHNTRDEALADAKERARFARQLADYLNEGVAGRRCNALVLIATSTMLGELRPCLNHAAEKAVKRSIVSDLTRYQGADLRQRVDQALQLPD